MLDAVMSKLSKIAKDRTKDVLLDWWFPCLYRISCSKTISKKKVMFVDPKETQIPDSFKLIHGWLVQEGSYEIEFLTSNKLSGSYFKYLKSCNKIIKSAATAEVIFLNDSSDVLSCIPLRPESRIIQLWHGCGAFKKWGMSTAELKFGGSKEEKLKHPFYDNLSLVSVSSPEVVWAYSEAMSIEREAGIIKPLGVSRTDVYFNSSFVEESCKKLKEEVELDPFKKIILYSPTFRGSAENAQAPDRLDIRALMDAFHNDYVLLIKQHPYVKMRPAIPSECQEFAFDVSDVLSIDSLLCVADICITDYSSLIFEYSIFAKPMVFFAFDREEYNDWRGFYYPYEELTPGPVFETNNQVIEYIKNVASLFDENQVKEFNKKFMSSCDGFATNRLIEYVFGAQNEPF